MASAIFDTHAFVKRLTAAGMPEQQADILADEQFRLLSEQVATKGDVAAVRADIDHLRAELEALERRMRDQLTVPFRAMLAAAVIIVAALVRLL